MPDSQKVRVRFAPSPTGDPHIGSLWTALFNWIFARKHRGSFILRIEDTDRKRLVPGSIEKIQSALEWLDLRPDEGPQAGGGYGPYIQSERLHHYRKVTEHLLHSRHAYYCFCSEARLAALRDQQAASKRPPRYDKHCARIPFAEAMQRVTAGEPHVVRLNLPEEGVITVDDIIRGQVAFRFDQSDDTVILKSDGFPTYHLANVVDDHLMEISHVIRAEEWLPSVPKHLFLYRALGWEPPRFAHLPLLLGPDRGKLSKRHGATSALSFRDEGFLPEAMRNFLVLMGWHPAGDRELMTLAETIEAFRLEDVHSAGAIFDRTKLLWMNRHYLHQLPDEKFYQEVKSHWRLPPGPTPEEDYCKRIFALVKDRISVSSEITLLAERFFPTGWDQAWSTFDRNLLIPRKSTQSDSVSALAFLLEQTRAYSDWRASHLKEKTLAAIRQNNLTNAATLWPARVALSLAEKSPDIFQIMHAIGKQESIRRLTLAHAKLSELT